MAIWISPSFARATRCPLRRNEQGTKDADRNSRRSGGRLGRGDGAEDGLEAVRSQSIGYRAAVRAEARAVSAGRDLRDAGRGPHRRREGLYGQLYRPDGLGAEAVASRNDG